MAGDNNDQKDAATITPAAKPKLISNNFLCNRIVSKFNLGIRYLEHVNYTYLGTNLSPIKEYDESSAQRSQTPREQGTQEGLR